MLLRADLTSRQVMLSKILVHLCFLAIASGASTKAGSLLEEINLDRCAFPPVNVTIPPICSEFSLSSLQPTMDQSRVELYLCAALLDSTKRLCLLMKRNTVYRKRVEIALSEYPSWKSIDTANTVCEEMTFIDPNTTMAQAKSIYKSMTTNYCVSVCMGLDKDETALRLPLCKSVQFAHQQIKAASEVQQQLNKQGSQTGEYKKPEAIESSPAANGSAGVNTQSSQRSGVPVTAQNEASNGGTPGSKAASQGQSADSMLPVSGNAAGKPVVGAPIPIKKDDSKVTAKPVEPPVDESIISKNKQTNGERKQPNGENKQPDGESIQPEGESKQPEGESKQPEGESKQPEGESKVPDGESKLPDGESKLPDGESKQPEGESKQPEGESKQPEGESKQPEGEDPMKGQVDPPEGEGGLGGDGLGGDGLGGDGLAEDAVGDLQAGGRPDEDEETVGEKRSDVNTRIPSLQQEIDSGSVGRGLGKFQESEDSHFFAYFMSLSALCVLGYLVYHNKRKIIAMAVEGKKGRNAGRRRPNSASYHKLDSNLEEAMSSNLASTNSYVIY